VRWWLCFAAQQPRCYETSCYTWHSSPATDLTCLKVFAARETYG
jgi:hypothetical protein